MVQIYTDSSHVRIAEDLFMVPKPVLAVLMPNQFRLLKISSKCAFGTLQNKPNF